MNESCGKVIAYLCDGRTPVRCILTAGHDRPTADDLRCARCGNARSNHRMISHELDPVLVPGTPHVARVEAPA
jgi:hypothetical protein